MNKTLINFFRVMIIAMIIMPASCSDKPEQVIKPENRHVVSETFQFEPVSWPESEEIVEEKQDRSFGPVFLPSSEEFSSVRLFYYTSQEQSTKVFFSMVGDIDWLRQSYEKKNIHVLDFKGLEEGVEYQFDIHSDSTNIQRFSKIRTVPYGRHYHYHFGIGLLEAELNFEEYPDFLVVLSTNRRVSEDEFRNFVLKNRELIGHTIMIPSFLIELPEGTAYGNEGDIYSYRYKNTTMIFAGESADIQDISSHLSGGINKQNFVFMTSDNIQNKTVLESNSRIDAVFAVESMYRNSDFKRGMKVEIQSGVQYAFDYK